ncbi:MAG: DUF4149 domain-containing protein [candidate division Zixibacteria bacterium]|nr:DUF4149 domain-containing protein [candidate division Zixibacteria bacterium]
MMRLVGFLRGIENLLLGLWVGGLVFLAAFAAPVVFKAFESRSAAGSVVAVIIQKFSRMEYFLALVLFFAAIVLLLITEKNWVRTYVSIALILMFLFATLYGRVWRPQMSALRTQITSFDVPSEQDTSPARREFEKLHRRYTALVVVNLLLGVSVLILKGFETAGRRRREMEGVT